MLILGGIIIFQYFTASDKETPHPALKKIVPAETVDTIKKKAVRKTAKLNIVSYPPSAKVFINGYYKGRTPAIVKVTATKGEDEYKLVILKNEYQRWEKIVMLKQGDNKDIKATLFKNE